MVPEPVDTFEDFSIPKHNGSVLVESSESSWHARSSALSHSPSAMDSDDENAATVMFELLPDTQQRGGLPRRSNRDLIDGWRQRVHAGEHPHALFHAPPASDASSNVSHTTVSSVSTVRDLADRGDPHGTYVTRPARGLRHDYAYAGYMDIDLYHVG
ncbi:hypothetical protein BC628DRAFT_738273 [Trametes gibbosa]|nr:hypothetical protein BC628DRAFT_738273 [Trametes gibbosa]